MASTTGISGRKGILYERLREKYTMPALKLRGVIGFLKFPGIDFSY